MAVFLYYIFRVKKVHQKKTGLSGFKLPWSKKKEDGDEEKKNPEEDMVKVNEANRDAQAGLTQVPA